MSRFATVSDSDIEAIIKGKDAENTKKLTETLYNILLSYCKEKGINLVVESISREDLDSILSRFYVEVRKSNGTMYKINSFRGIRFAIQRMFKSIRGEDFDVIEGSEFAKANSVYSAQCVVLKRKGLGKTDHHRPINEADLKKLYDSDVFALTHPVSLQHKVFFDIMLFFCRRGQENLRKLTIHDFRVNTNANGIEYVEKVTDEMTKNRRENNDSEDVALMEATGKEDCPVASYKLYLSKLNPNLPALFQRPKKSPPSNDKHWYDNMVIGEKKLAAMMKTISKEAGLACIYTNHCIRATAITILDSKGVEARDIMSVSGHRSESSLRSYCKTSDNRKREMSNILSDAVSGSSKKKVRVKSSEEIERMTRTFDFGIDIFDDGTSDDKTLVHDVIHSVVDQGESSTSHGNVFKFDSCEVHLHFNK